MMNSKNGRIYSYIITHDTGAAPNPFWGICSLAICKPAIRRTANVGDWVIGTGSKNSKCNDLVIHDLSGSLVYAMKVTKKLTMKEYDQFCRTIKPNKIPSWRTNNWRHKVGDCIYDYENSVMPSSRRSVHDEGSRKRDLGGVNVLLSKRFYYFGEAARPLPKVFNSFIKRSQGHLIISDEKLILDFEIWIDKFTMNKIYADPQRRWAFDRYMTRKNILKCNYAK